MTELPLYVHIITPEETLFTGEATMVVIPGEEGEFGVLHRHTPLVSLLKEGDIRLYKGKEIFKTLSITGGVAEVSSQGCQILADRCLAVHNTK